MEYFIFIDTAPKERSKSPFNFINWDLYGVICALSHDSAMFAFYLRMNGMIYYALFVLRFMCNNLKICIR